MLRFLLFQNFRLVLTLDHWFKSRFTPAGLFVLAAWVMSGVLGIDTQRTLAYQLFALLTILIALAFLGRYLLRLQVSVQRQLPHAVTVEQPCCYRILIHNHTRHWQSELTLLETIKHHPPRFETFLHTQAPGEAQRNWFDRYVGYPRWRWLMRLGQGTEVPKQALAVLPPAPSTLEVTVTLTPLRRGYIHFTHLNVMVPEPLGLMNALYTLTCADKLLVLPKRYPLGEIPLLGSRKYHQGGVHLALSVGNSSELMSLREYRPGDSRRYIHWKSWAKLGQPVVKVFEDEFFVRHGLILDTYASPQSHFEAAVSVAASVVCSPRNQEVLLDLLFVGTQQYCFTTGRGLSQSTEFLEILACVQPSPQEDFSQLVTLVRAHLPLLSGCVCVLLTWDEMRQQLIDTLKAAKITFIALLVTELEFTLPTDIHRIHPHTLAADLMRLFPP